MRSKSGHGGALPAAKVDTADTVRTNRSSDYSAVRTNGPFVDTVGTLVAPKVRTVATGYTFG